MQNENRMSFSEGLVYSQIQIVDQLAYVIRDLFALAPIPSSG
jgi:hypothetical protein